MLIGYARISKADGSQSLDLQRDALREAGVSDDAIYQDQASGQREDRPRQGDVIVVWRLDRLGRNLRHLVNLVQDLNDRDIGIRVLAAGSRVALPYVAGFVVVPAVSWRRPCRSGDTGGGRERPPLGLPGSAVRGGAPVKIIPAGRGRRTGREATWPFFCFGAAIEPNQAGRFELAVIQNLGWEHIDLEAQESSLPNTKRNVPPSFEIPGMPARLEQDNLRKT